MKKYVLGIILLIGIMAQAEEIRLDLGSSFDAGVNWNVVSGSQTRNVGSLIDYNTGLETSVAVSLPFTIGIAGSNQWIGGDKGWMNDGAGDDCFYMSGNGTVTFSGLMESEYQVEVLVAASIIGSNRLTTYRIGGNAADRTYNGTPVPDPWGWGDDGTRASNWMIWNTVDASGGHFDIAMTTEDDSGISAVRIMAIPEPATLSMIALFGGAAVIIRRKFML